MLKVVKFGGSSLADAAQFEKVRQIVTADPARRVVVVSAPGKRFSADHKITDFTLPLLCPSSVRRQRRRGIQHGGGALSFHCGRLWPFC